MRTTYKKKNLFLGLAATLAIGSVGFGLAFVNPVSANAEEKTFYSTGTQLNAQEEQVRFNATLTESEYAKYFDENGVAKAGTQTGMLILPWDLFDGNGMEVLNLETYAANQNLVQNVDTTNLWSENGEGGYEAWAKMNGSIIGEKNYNRALYYVCYVTDGTTAQYTEAQKTSMSYEALLAQSLNISEDTKAELAEKYMLKYSVTFNDAYARTMSVQYGTKFSEMTSRELTDLYWDAEYTQQVSASDYITCNSTIYMKAEDQNTAELMSFDYAVDTTKNGLRQDNNAASELSIDWQSSFEGESGVMSMEYTHGAGEIWTPRFTVYPRQSVATDSAIYSDYKYLVLRMYIVKNETYVSDWTYVALNSRDDVGCKYILSEYDYNKWIEIKFELSDLQDSLGSGDATYGKGLYFYGTYGAKDTVLGTEKGLFYVSNVYLEKGSDDIIQLTGTNYAKYTKAYKSGTTFAWSQYHNALQVNNGGNANYFGVNLQGLWDYETVKDSYDYVTVDVYLPTNATLDYDGTTLTTQSAAMRCAAPNINDLRMTLIRSDGVKTAGSMRGAWHKVILPLESLQYSYLSVYQQSKSATTRIYVRNIELKKADLEVTISSPNGLYYGVEHQMTVTKGGQEFDTIGARYYRIGWTGGSATEDFAYSSTTKPAKDQTTKQMISVFGANGEFGYAIISGLAAAPTTA
jgi:hypothetical protein